MDRPNAKQWEAIRRADRHVLVAAGAGTGKTSTVVNRVLFLLGAEIEGQRHPSPLRLSDIAAITYTNAAAADLKGKLRKALRAAGLRDAVYEVDGARISTIHAFCGDILRDFALRSSRSPVSVVLEEGESAALTAEVVRETVLQALDENAVPGLDELFALWPIDTVENWMVRLVGDADRMLRLQDHAADMGPRERTLLELTGRALQALTERLDRSGAVDFDRMIVLTRDLIRNRPPVRRALQHRIRTLIVDEFQDVDPVQKEIAFLLGDPASRREDTTRLMLVGDPKQSIYRFRRADVTVWSEVEADFRERELGEVIALEENYRSVEPVLAFVDAAIGPVLDRPVSGEVLQEFEVAFRSVRSTRPAAGGERAVELLVVPNDDEGKAPKAEEVRLREAESVARRMRELNAGGTRWGDMAVLLAGWGALEVYESALRAAGIPTYALRTDGFYARREVLDLVLALEVVRDPADDRALLGFLRSPFVGLKDETLLEIACAARPPYWETLDHVATGEPALLKRGFRLLQEHVALRDRIPTHELLESLLQRSGYLAYLVMLGDAGQQAIANVRKLVGLARQLADHSLGDFLRIAKEVRDRGDREGDARLYGQGDDVVTITSVHSAKGLEWKVVFWCDLIRGAAGHHTESLLVGPDRIAVKDPDLVSKDQPFPWTSLAEQAEQEASAERKRLWYVAATRAMDRLILSGLTLGKIDRECPSGAVREVLGALDVADGGIGYVGQGGKRFEAVVRRIPALDEAAAAAGRAPASLPDTELLARLPAPHPRLEVAAGRIRHSATELMAFERCERRHWMRYVAGIHEPEVDRSGLRFMDAIARGQIVHDVLEHLREEEELDALLESAIGRWDAEAPPAEQPVGRRYREALREEIQRVQGEPAYAALAASPDVRRELAFLYVADPDSAIEGKIDLAARDGDGLVLLDVKTYQGDAESARRHAEQYAIQRDVYVTAVEAIGGEPVARFAFQFSRAGLHHSTPIDEGLRAAGQARIDALVARVGAGTPRLTEHPAECRFCGYRAVGWCGGVPSDAEVHGAAPA